VHGMTDRYQKMLRQKFAGQRTFQVGDMGFGFKNVPGLHKDIMSNGNHKFIRGNHDSPAECRKWEWYAGDYGYSQEDKFFWLGGAYSIDYMWRVPGRTWWVDEELSSEELQKAYDLYVASKPEVVATHEAPSEIARYTLHVACRMEKISCVYSRTSQALQKMFDAWQPKEWIFGHYHVNTFTVVPANEYRKSATKFTCVNELSTYTYTDEPLIVVPDGSPDA